MDRKPLPCTILYPESTVREAFHKLSHLRNDIRGYEHPQDQAEIQAVIDRLEPLVAPHLKKNRPVLTTDRAVRETRLDGAPVPVKGKKGQKYDELPPEA
jgi:hypothetical protein